jgi:hypothetical protein
MSALDNLPPDQRAVLQLVLQRGRSYDDIAELLSIDRAAVRQRALAALDALGPQTRVARERRALITDYLLGQLPARPADEVRDRLAGSAGERAWARVVSAELSPIADGRLGEIPDEEQHAPPETTLVAAAPELGDALAAAAAAPAPAAAPATTAKDHGPPKPRAPGAPRSSRLGGAILLGLGALIAAVVVIIIVATGGSDHKKTTSTPTRASTTTTPAATTPVAQVNLSAAQSGSKAVGIAQVIRTQNGQNGLILVATNVKPNTKHDAYAVWLYNTPSDDKILGFVNPGVGANGRLQTSGLLPANASHFHQLLVTLETRANPKGPGTIVLAGPMSLSG